MATSKISALVAIAAAAITATSVVPITSDSAGLTTYKMSMAQMRTAIFGGGASYAASDILSIGAAAPAAGIVRLDGGTQAGASSVPIISAVQTWNAVGTTFTGWLLNVTSTASSASSLLLDLQLAGVSQFKVSKAGVVTAPSFVGALTGNASTATAMQTPRAINGVNFDGSAPITVTAAAGTLTGATLNATVTGSSLTSVGTLVSLTVSGAASLAALTASGGITSTLTVGAVSYAGSATTGALWHDVQNTSGRLRVGIEGSVAGTIWAGGAAYAGFVGTVANQPLDFATNGTRRGGFSATGAFDLTNGLTVSAGGITVSAGTSALAAVTATGSVTLNGTTARLLIQPSTATNGAFATFGNNGGGGGGTGYVGLENSTGNDLTTSGGIAYSLAIVSPTARTIAFAPGGTTTVSMPTGGGLAFVSGAPGTLADGQIWYDGTNLRARLGGITKTITVS
jgi:hypothetical protein